MVPVTGCDREGRPLYSLGAVAGERMPILGGSRMSFPGRVARNRTAGSISSAERRFVSWRNESSR
ncbi:hypothetical protein AQ802_03680 [Burkholderia pseudomallei]|uniref:Uncharacterized protein n=1 Tax=Burkholderia pseudomallei 1710a TaxID=320371 RepID=A0A0E1VVB5_BURPE|nr:hypothetical protein BOC51_33595 [Burkholderia pseudomallei]EET03941.1 hypothetical protein BURPS1710A_A0796 [Burkholderia pseudomallei 1710a]AYX38100.1 hypothetical protein EGY15_23735 [Burkholderia pseudomallei]KJR91515.1 hypothetical protein VP95_23685 [Burkholderia pseudomallei]OAB07769.1 hypothetical protein AQ841_05805 [Burkholderia pseudomallei]